MSTRRTLGRRAGSRPEVERLAAERVHPEITRIELELLELRLSVAARRAGDPPDAWTTADEARVRQARQRQWDLAQTVPLALRGQALGALAP